jgi:membrane fusion protein (multidrug efflux system)
VANTQTTARKPRLFLRIFIVLILMAAIAASLGYKKYLQIGVLTTQGSVQPPPTNVTVASAESAKWNKRIKAAGTLVASQGVDLSTEVAGIVKSIHFDSGQEIIKGALLLELNNQSELATLGQAQAKFNSDNSQYQRLLKLKDQSFVTRNDIDTQTALVDISNAQISVAEVALAKKSINAPFSGKLGIRLIDIGEYITPGTPLVTLQSVDKLLLDFTLPESNFNDLKVGQDIRFKVRSFADKSFTAEVKAWSPVLDESTRNITIQAEVDNKNRLLAPGMFAEMEVNSAQKIALVTLPETAIFYNIYGEAVYILEKQPQSADGSVAVNTNDAPDYRLAARQVRVAYRSNGKVGIISGIDAGDLAVTSGQLKLYPSLRVAIVDDAPEFKAANAQAE